MSPPRYCDFLEEELVVDDGIKTLDLHLRAIFRVRSAAYFDSIYLGLILLCIPTVSSFQDNILFVFK